MPITGTFEADFSQFATATQGAVQDLLAVQQSATSTTNAVTQLEKATTTTAGSVGTLRSSYQQFDGILSAVGIHIGPQITALEEIGNAAGKSGLELGAFTVAGQMAGAALAGWEFGRWIAGITGADKAISNFTASLFGWGDLAKETAGAVQDSIDLAFQRTGIHATSAAEALRLNTKWAKEHQAAAKEDAAEVKAAADAYAKWQAATEEIATATKGYQAVLDNLDPYVVAAAKHALEHKVNQETVATAYKLTGAQISAVVQSMAAEKKAIDDTAAARRVHDAEMMTSYNTQIKLVGDLEKAQSVHFGLDGQIDLLHQLAASEDAATRATYAQLDSEKDRMKLVEANAKRQTEIEIEIGKLREQQTGIMAASTLRAIDLQTQLNKAYGLDAKGAILLPQDALIELNKKIDTINATMVDGTEKTLALAVANKEYTDGLLAGAKAADTSTTSIEANTAAKVATAQASTAAAAAAGGSVAQPGTNYTYPGTTFERGPSATYPGMTGQVPYKTAQQVSGAGLGGGAVSYSGSMAGGFTDPMVMMYVGMGYTLNEALQIASGNGAQIIGRSSSQLAALGFRAAGGPVSAGASYVVGERGPEVFSPASSGTILPNVGAGGRPVQVNVYGNVLSTQAELAALVEAAMVAAYRRGGNRLPV